VVHLLINPIAGRGRARAHAALVEGALRDRGTPYTVLRSERAGHVAELAALVPPGGTLVLVGGDGSVHEVLPACLAHNLRLVIIPSGSGDDFAFALGIPRHTPRATFALLDHGRERWVDLGEVNGIPFANAFGSGFDAEVARRVLAAPPLFKGLGRYLYGVATGLRDLRLAPLKLELTHPDGRHGLHVGDSLLVSAQNGPRAGGSFLFAPGARVDDGVLDVVVAGRFSRLGTLAILGRVAKGEHERHPQVSRFAATELTVRWSIPTAAHAEGEPLPTAAVYHVRILPAALRVMAPTP
jgi:diacylglycerol kinase (ATP)